MLINEGEKAVIRRWKFITTVFGGYKPKKVEWYFEGTKGEATQKFIKLIEGGSSPFVVFDFMPAK